MTEQILAKIEELKKLEKEIEPRIQDLEKKRENEIEQIKKKYSEKISEVSNEVEAFKKELMEDMYNSFEKAVMDEFDAKRSTSDYTITSQIKEYKKAIKNVELFPDDLINRLNKIIAEEEPIENIAYDLEKIKTQYF